MTGNIQTTIAPSAARPWRAWIAPIVKKATVPMIAARIAAAVSTPNQMLSVICAGDAAGMNGVGIADGITWRIDT